MDSGPTPIPRLRISRLQSSMAYASDDVNGPLAGPSRFSGEAHDQSDESDTHDQPTPRIPLSSLNNGSSGSILPEDTPAARLRALLNLVPNDKPKPTEPEDPLSSSEMESDFEPPKSTISATPSFARESLRDIFSHALREPGDTPQKVRSRWRRNSIDASEVEGSPRIEKVQTERARNIGKRRSLSDEEADKSTRSSSRSAATFDLLRERLSASQTTQLNEQGMPTALFTDDTATTNDSIDSDTFRRRLESSQATPPAATSTPQQSLHLSTQVPFQSNLLENDSSMQAAMLGSDSFSSSEQGTSHILPPKSPFTSKTPKEVGKLTHKSIDHFANSSLGAELQNREKPWAKKPLSRSGTPEPAPKQSASAHTRNSHSISHSKSGISSNGQSQRTIRRSSITSNHSANSDTSARSASFSSHTDNDMERSVSRSSFNRPTVASLSRQNSDRNVHSPFERTRTLSVPLRPDSALSNSSHTDSRHRYSRAISPSNSSIHSRDDEEEIISAEVQHELVHERERNWNAPRPVWHQYGHHSRAAPSSPTHSTMSSTSSVSSVASISGRPRTQSLRASATPRSPMPVSPSPSNNSRSSRPSLSPVQRRTPAPWPEVKRPLSYPTMLSSSKDDTIRPKIGPSPRSPIRHSELESSDGGFHRAPPSPTPSSKSSRSSRTSLIPMRTPFKLKTNDKNPPVPSHHLKSPSPADTMSPELNNTIKSPENKLSLIDDDDALQQQESTPTLRTILPPPSSGTSAHASPISPERSLYSIDEMRLKKALANSPPSPPPSPPSDSSTPQQLSNLSIFPSTPPQASSTKALMEFRTPPPPEGLPDLPGPPSVSSDDDDSHSLPYIANETALKTPKPPGAWLATPLPERVNGYARDPFPEDTSQDSGLATPAESLSGSNPVPPRTPAPPGAWMNTPFSRKSVRFDTDRIESDLSGTDFTTEDEMHDAPVLPVQERVNPSPAGERVSPSRPRTPDQSRPISPTVKSPRKTPSVRILDAFGRECEPLAKSSNSIATPRNWSVVRIVDDMGREIETSSFVSTKEHGGSLSRSEALSKVRQGLSELVQGLDEFERADGADDSHLKRMAELQHTSRSARESRGRLLNEMKGFDLRNKLEELRVGMQKSTVLTRVVDSRLPSVFWSWIFWVTIVSVYMLTAGLNYTRAKHGFLTTYFDPASPSLHYYIIRPIIDRRLPWSVLFSDILIQKGFFAFFSGFLDNLASILWECVGADDSRTISWPPT